MLLDALVFTASVIGLFLLAWTFIRFGIGTVLDWIVGTVEPFAQPDTPDEPRPLRIVQDRPAPTVRGRPDVLVLDLPPHDLAVRKQVLRNDFTRAELARHLTVPHPRVADRWWPGTQPSDAELAFARGDARP